ncbi:MAG: HlyC/CorC family transporter [Gammaproteobacteria bacterium]
MNDDHPSRTPSSWYERFRKSLRFYPQDREELIELLRALEQRNLIHPEALAMVEGAIVVSDMRVCDIMVPRAEMVIVQDDAELENVLPEVIRSGHSRFPVLDSKHDRVAGILLAKDLLSHLAQPEKRVFHLREALRPAVFVPESKRLDVLLREFRSSRNHMAIVVDEYGHTAGLVTIEDVIEQIVGEISDEYDVGDEGFIKAHREDRYIVKARTPIEDFNAHFHTSLAGEDYDTVGGLVLKSLGRMPSTGESVKLAGFRFTVLRADPRRIRLLRVDKLPGEKEDHDSQAQSG